MTLRKKSVSPIIATILLVVVSLILVGILLSWGQNFIQRSTSDADSALDRKCIGADISINYCEYDSDNGTNTLNLIIVNTGKIDFKADTNLPVILIDSNKTLYNGIVNLFDEGEEDDVDSLAIGASKMFEIEIDEELTTPIDLEIRSSQCTNFFKRTICD